MTTKELTAKAVGKVWSFGVTGFESNSAELVFVLDTADGRMDFKTEDDADPRAFAAMASVLSAAYGRGDAVLVTYFEDTRLVNFIGVPADHW